MIIKIKSIIYIPPDCNTHVSSLIDKSKLSIHIYTYNMRLGKLLVEYGGVNRAELCECRKCVMLCYLEKRQHEISYSDSYTYYTPLKNSPNFLSFLQVDNSFFTPWNWNPNPFDYERSYNPKKYMSFEDGGVSFFENFDGFKYV